MRTLQSITSDPVQNQNIILPDKTTLLLNIRWVPMQFGWFIDRMTYGDFVLYGYRIVNSPNMLQQYRNQIPFGLACVSTDSREPSLQFDFSSGASVLYLLDETEVAAFTEYLNGD